MTYSKFIETTPVDDNIHEILVLKIDSPSTFWFIPVRDGLVRTPIPLLITALLLLPGCIGGDEEVGPIALKVSADNIEGHIEVVKGTND